jgi:transposase
MAKAIGCSIPTVVRVRDDMGRFGTEQPPRQYGGRVPLITDCMRDRLREYLSEHSDRYLEEMRALLFNEFDVLVSTSTISRSLRSMRWSKKVNRRRAKEQNLDL